MAVVLRGRIRQCEALIVGWLPASDETDSVVSRQSSLDRTHPVTLGQTDRVALMQSQVDSHDGQSRRVESTGNGAPVVQQVRSGRHHHDSNRPNPGFRAVSRAKLDIQHEIISPFGGREKYRRDQQMSDAKSNQQPSSESWKDTDDRRLNVSHTGAAHANNTAERSIN